MRTRIARSLSTSFGKHYYQFFKGREDYFDIAIPFLRLGLENREACLWVVSSEMGILEAIEALQRNYDLTRALEDGQLLILPAERWYLDRGRFSERKVLKRFKEFIRERARRGFAGFRSIGDVSWLEDTDWDKFQAYESKCREWIRNLRFVAICAFPIERCSLTQTKDVLDGHDGVFLTRR